MTLEDLFSREYAPLRRLGEKSINCYRVSLRHFDRHLGEPARLDHLSDLTVARFISARERETCRATAARDRVQLLALWRYAARKRMKDSAGEVLPFPEVPILKAPVRVPVAYTSDDVALLIREARRLSGTVAGIPAADWWSSLLLALWESGERINAAMGLKWREVDLVGRRLTFRAETRKNQTRDLDRQITPTLAVWLSGRLQGPTALVWPWDRNACRLWGHLKGIAKRAGVQYRGFHGIRRAAVSYAEAAMPGAGQRLADHSSPAITVKSYLDPRIVPQGPSAPDLLPPLDLTPPT